MNFRKYNHKKDSAAVRRIWKECGWLEKDKEKIFNEFVKNQYALIAELNNEAECFVDIVKTGGLRRLTCAW